MRRAGSNGCVARNLSKPRQPACLRHKIPVVEHLDPQRFSDAGLLSPSPYNDSASNLLPSSNILGGGKNAAADRAKYRAPECAGMSSKLNSRLRKLTTPERAGQRRSSHGADAGNRYGRGLRGFSSEYRWHCVSNSRGYAFRINCGIFLEDFLTYIHQEQA